ncbi:histidine phosphatase family protein [Novosphingobium sp. M1R2S20]|uniref:Histidine phosphatase family protein n=1 Tax=Novosphingobium rhizovicinum TaxID=3228928 RepID=A0ABV3RE38_9SPHN
MTSRVIHLLRHGPPVRTGLLLGHVDEPAQNANCPLILGRARALPLRALVSSDLMRAAAQASHLADQLGLPLTLSRNWRELDFGEWDGEHPHTLSSEALARFWDDPDGCPPPCGERWSDLRSRVAGALAGLDTHTLVLAHAGAMRAAVSVLTGLDHRGVWAIDLPYRALLTLRIWPDLNGQIIGLAGDEL